MGVKITQCTFKCQQSQLEPHWLAALMSHVPLGQTDMKCLLSGCSSASGGSDHVITAASRYFWLPPPLRPAMSAGRWPSRASHSPCAGRWPVSRRDTRHMIWLARVKGQSHAGRFPEEGGKQQLGVPVSPGSGSWAPGEPASPAARITKDQKALGWVQQRD